MDNDSKFSLLRGLYSANGSVCDRRVTYKTASRQMVQNVQLLLSSVGIRSYYTTNKAHNVEFKNGIYECKTSFDINITADMDKFYQSIGFIQKYKMAKLKNVLENRKRIKSSKENVDIIGTESIGFYDVWDITVDNQSHTFWCNGFNISNCSEFVNIPYTSCSLGSINLSTLVDGKKFNWEKYDALIAKATRFIDSTIDNNKFPLKKIKDVTLKTRPIGLGVMGLAHALFKKELPYNSDKAIKLTEELMRYLTLRAMRESIELAKDKGAYEAFDYALFMKANERFFSKSCRDLDVDKIAQDIKKHGVRNSSFTSIAPTGTISFIANVSGGIEPVFALSYTRRIEIDNYKYESVYVSDPVFDEYLTATFDEDKKAKVLKEVAENRGSCRGCKDIPKKMREIFLVAEDIKPMEHLDILEAVANNVSLSVSKTVNLSKDSTPADVAEVFLSAHKRGIIGVTVYREGSRDGILLHNGNGNGIVERPAPVRPVDLPCDIHRITVQGEKWIVFIGLLKNKPYEIFAGKVDEVNLPKNIKNGIITKVKSSQYAFKYDDEILVKNICKTFDNETHEALTRMISTALQNGTLITRIMNQLSKSKGTIVDFSKAIMQALKHYIDDGENAGKCPTCSNKLIFMEGCIKCSNPECSYSKCG